MRSRMDKDGQGPEARGSEGHLPAHRLFGCLIEAGAKQCLTLRLLSAPRLTSPVRPSPELRGQAP